MKKNISNIVTILAALIIVVAGIEAINIYLYPFIIAFMSIYYDIIQEFRQKVVQAEAYFLLSWQNGLSQQ